MKQQEIQSYCERYFTHVGAAIVCRADGYMEVDLPVEIDKELTDRPYYWMWIEATGQTPPQTRLRLQFDPNVALPEEASTTGKIEVVSLGSFRLNKIFESVAKRGRITKQFQTSPPHIAGKPLEPWLMVPYKVSFIADLRRDEIRSVGVNLITGEMLSNFYPITEDVQWSTEPPAGALPHESAEDLLTIWGKLKHYIASEIDQEDSTWADEAGMRLQDELEQLETYYDSLLLDAKDESELLARDKQVRIQELKWRTQPKIQVEPIFMALLYMESAWARTQLNARSELA